MNAVMKLAPSDTGLVRYKAMCRAITECYRVDEVKVIHDKARALEVYAKQAKNTNAERRAADIRLRAERRVGELFQELHRSEVRGGGDRKSEAAKNQMSHAGTFDRPKSEYAQALERTGTTRQTAHRYQQLAAVPAEKFDRHLKDPEIKPTASGILRAPNGATRMDDGSWWVWGRLRELERNGVLNRDAADLYGGMTDTMQADVRRVLPAAIDWLNALHEVAHVRA